MIAVLLCGFIVIPAFAQDAFETEKPSYRGTGKGEAMLFDLVFLRPAGLAASVLGFGGVIVSLPFSITANNTREVGEAMYLEPIAYTFVRPLGDIYQPASMLDH